MPWTIMHGRTEDFVMLGEIQWIIEHLLQFLFNVWELLLTLAPAAYSHGSVAKQWARNMRPQDQNHVDVPY